MVYCGYAACAPVTAGCLVLQAGMVGLDKTKINSVVYNMSKNSRHFKNAQRLDNQSNRLVRCVDALVKAADGAVPTCTCAVFPW